ncbi:hypothetical protein [Nocardioides pinisoli]|uniref:Uncharacterized protein n=1 Tax=Nocardioides pinisoli TaxID=2950279 RepID=A0ABT1KRI7_9ACTN|nr:hypothetical protein [Nocardioides pinisoli]MCP3420340.1 hypothetical protein [Nocardioides pinisoli]
MTTKLIHFLAALTAAVTVTLLHAPSYATEGWSPDAVMVMPLSPEDLTATDRELLDVLDAEPGDVLDVEYEKVELGEFFGGDAESVPFFKGTEIEVPPFSPLFTPAGRARAEGDEGYPEYASLLAWDGSDEKADQRAYQDKPAQGVSTDGWKPENLAWVSGDEITVTSLPETVTWVRVGFGIQDVWVDARNLMAPEESEAVAHFRADNLAETAAEEVPDAEPTQAVTPRSESTETTEPGSESFDAGASSGGVGLPLGSLAVGSLVLGGLALSWRHRRGEPTRVDGDS